MPPRFDRATSFQKLGEEDEALDLHKRSGTDLDSIVRVRNSVHGNQLKSILGASSSSAIFEDEEDEGQDENAGLEREARRQLESVSPTLTLLSARRVRVNKDSPEAISLGTLRTPYPGERGEMDFYSNSPLTPSTPVSFGTPPRFSSPGTSEGGDGDVLVCKLDDIHVNPLQVKPKFLRLESHMSNASSGGEGSPGLEAFAANSQCSDSPRLSLPQRTHGEVYHMAVRAVMAAWEARAQIFLLVHAMQDPSWSIVERTKLADLLRVAFGVSRPRHMDVMIEALRENSQLVDELASRIDDIEEREVEDFLEASAADEWERQELETLRRLLEHQLTLPQYNGMLEVAVLQGLGLIERKAAKSFACLAPTGEKAEHFAVVDVQPQTVSLLPGQPLPPPPGSMPAPMRTNVGRGTSPKWSIKNKPYLLTHPPASLRLQVCTSGLFDETNEANVVAGALPVMSAIPMDTFSSLGQHTVGWSRVALSADNSQHETSYLLPVERKVTLMHKARGALGFLAAPNDEPPLTKEGAAEKANRKWKITGEARLVIRYVPETRTAQPSPEVVAASKRASSRAPARPSCCPSPTLAAAVATMSPQKEVALPGVMSSTAAAQNYEALLSALWECWGKEVTMPQEEGHTFTVGQGSDPGPSTTATRDSSPVIVSGLKSVVKQQIRREHPQLGAPTTGLDRFRPGEPWNSILDAVGKLFRIRDTWRQLTVLKFLLRAWRLEPDYLDAVLVIWKPVVNVARDGKLTRREALLHVACTRLIVRNCIRALECYSFAFGEGCSVSSTVSGLKRLMALTGLAIRYDTRVESLVEPLKIHVRRCVRRRMRKFLPKANMSRDPCLVALKEAVEQATTSLQRDLELAEGFPESLDLPLFTARLRYKKIADHLLRLFTGPGVMAYDKLVMALEDAVQALHILMLDSGVAVRAEEDALSNTITPLRPMRSSVGSDCIKLLNMSKLLGRSLLKWVRDIGLNMKEWVDNAVQADIDSQWKPIGGQVYYSSSVVDLLRIFTEVIEKARERMPKLEHQTVLHSSVFETLQIGMHYVNRHYIRILEDQAVRDLLEKKQARHAELSSEAKMSEAQHSVSAPLVAATSSPDKTGGGGGAAGLNAASTGKAAACVSPKTCVLLSNLRAAQENMPSVGRRLLELITEEDHPTRRPEDGLQVWDDGSDNGSEISFVSDDVSLDAPGIELNLTPSGNVRAADPGSSQKQGMKTPQIVTISSFSSNEDDMTQRRRVWQKYCAANERTIDVAISNCINCVADTIQVKLLLEIVRLLKSERRRAKLLDSVVEGGSKRNAWDVFGGKQDVSPEEAAAVLKDVDLNMFMQSLLDSEVDVLAQHMVPSVFRSVMSTTWCSLVAALEDLVLGTAGCWDAITRRDARVISGLLNAASEWFHSDGDGLARDELGCISVRLRELLYLHSRPTTQMELKYNNLWKKYGGKDALRAARPTRATKAPEVSVRSPHRGAGEPMSSFEARFRADVRRGVVMIHLIRLLRQRRGDVNAVDTLAKALKDAAEFPMQVLFGKWEEQLLGKWPCMLWRHSASGVLYLSPNFVGFTTIRSDSAKTMDISMLLPLSQVSRMDLTYENHTQCLTFTMCDKTSHPFAGFSKTFLSRVEIYNAVSKAVNGSGSVLDHSLRGELSTEGAMSLGLPTGEEIFDSMECARLSGGGLWYNRGVLYVCKSFIMFDRPGKQRVTVRYGDVLELKLDDGPTWSAGAEQRLILVTRGEVGRLILCRFDQDTVVRCMTSIASQVANMNEYNDK